MVLRSAQGNNIPAVHSALLGPEEITAGISLRPLQANMSTRCHALLVNRARRQAGKEAEPPGGAAGLTAFVLH